MMNNEIKKYFLSEYIYMPYNDKTSISLNSEGLVKLNDKLCIYNGLEIHSPISGKAFGFSKMYGTNGETDVLIIENDYKDDKSALRQIEDIYSVNKDAIKNVIGDTDEINVKVNSSKNDARDYYILFDNINNILETLNLISEIYKDIKINIILNKRDLMSYNLLYGKLGTYPNIRVVFDNKINNYKTLYEIIDIYNKIKNKWVRDYIYFTLIYNKSLSVFKVKKYSNVRDILINNGVSYNNLSVNGIKINDKNYLLDDNVSYVEVS